MTPPTSHRSKSIGRRLERWLVGLVMSFMAFVGERVALRSVKKKGGSAPDATPEGTRVSTRGGEIDAG
jgi:hypothetical protein